MAIAFVTSASGNNYSGSNGTPAAAAFVATAGHLIVVAIRYFQGAGETITSVTDTAGNTYQVAPGAVHTDGGGNHIELWYAMNISGHATNVVTANMSATVPYWSLVAAEYSGLATTSAFDAATSGEEVLGGTDVVSGAFSTAQADELIFAGATVNAASGVWSVGTGLTTVRDQDSQNVTAIADKIVSSTQASVTATMTSTLTTAKMIVVATFKAAAGGGTSTTDGKILIAQS